MQTGRRFDVLRLIQCQKTCHRGMDSVRGRRLTDLLSEEKEISKEEFFSWVETMTKQLDQLYKDREEPCYQFLNPYSIIISTSRELFLLDYSSETNHKTILFINQRKIRNFFLPEGSTYYDRPSLALDLFGLGRTLQYILTYGQITPGLGKREELQLRKIISACLHPSPAFAYGALFRIKRRISGLSQKNKRQLKNHRKTSDSSKIKKEIPHEKGRLVSPRRKKAGKIIGIGGGILLILLAGWLFIPQAVGFEKREEKETAVRENVETGTQNPKRGEDRKGRGAGQKEKKKDAGQEVERDMAIAYVLEQGNEELGKAYLRMLAERGGTGKDIQIVAEGIRRKKGGKQIETSLKRLEGQEKQSRSRYYRRFLIQGYLQLKSTRGYEKVIEIGRECQKETWSEKEMWEIMEAMAIAWEELGETEKSAKVYENLIGLTKEEKKKESLYKKVDFLMRQTGQEEERGKLLEKGTEELKTSRELRNLHIKWYCDSKEKTREDCAGVIQKYLQDCPELREDRGFQKLQEEYGIREEEEKIWIEK
ncbi:hypothetical protein [Suipraeoptans intestinalis]|uniref:hypothetical protein n=1 Tax=Suipraeoptans intestinalis TaxID=2606628 RepID=UPI002A759F3A|nr:hypothetical protein [Suipraeoptans intestinalis]MDY3122696.1 hypothetical protein [Suipraeoptans intestinalis]